MSAHDLMVEYAQDRINGLLYDRPDLVRDYATTNLNPPEATVLVRYRDDFVQRRVFDIGCGAGRLATYLRPLTDHYTGMDISRHMVAYCRHKFAGLQFHQGDMRDLTRFAAGSFDAILAVFNLFDAVSHEDRLVLFAEMRRILSPHGLLVFSSHNRNYVNAMDAPRLHLSRNPITMLRHVKDYLECRSNHRRIKVFQRFEPYYALLNDCGHQFAVLHYYISREVQAKQLAGAGFELLECLDEAGLTLRPGDDDSAFASIHYVARPYFS